MTDYSKGVLIAFLGVLVVSPDVLLIRLIDAETFTILAWRSGLSGIAILLGYAAVARGGAVAAFRGVGYLGLVTAIIFSVGTFCYLYSVTHTSAANTLLISATAPVFAGLISIAFLSERISNRTWLTIIGGLLGITVIGYGSSSGQGGDIAGDLAAVGGALSMAITFTVARARKSVSMVPAMAIAGLLTGAAAAFVAPTVSISSNDVIWALLLGLIVVPGGFALLTTAPRYIPSPNVSLILLLEAIFGPLLVWWIIGENPGNYTLAGGAIILIVLSFGFLGEMKARQV